MFIQSNKSRQGKSPKSITIKNVIGKSATVEDDDTKKEYTFSTDYIMTNFQKL